MHNLILEMHFCAKVLNPRHHFIYLFIISDKNVLKYIYHSAKLKFYLVFQSTIKLTPLSEPHIVHAKRVTIKCVPLNKNTENRFSPSTTILKKSSLKEALLHYCMAT